MSNNVIKLRPHHLLCILTYVGEGYSKTFTDNFDAIVDKINSGHITQIEIVNGPDDICALRLCDKDDKCHCYEHSIQERDVLALRDIGNILNMEILAVGEMVGVSPSFWVGLRAAFQNKSIRPACEGCEWFDLCSEVAEIYFGKSKLK